jgi:hypothetical protein
VGVPAICLPGPPNGIMMSAMANYTATIDVSAAEYYYWPEVQYQVNISLSLLCSALLLKGHEKSNFFVFKQSELSLLYNNNLFCL